MPTKTTDAPTQTPPQTRSAARTDGGGQHAGGESRPKDIEAGQLEQHSAVSAPTLTPEGTTGAGVAAASPPTAVTGTWTTNVTVDAMWAINETRNAFFHTGSGAWVKLFNGSDSAFTNLATLAGQAKQTGHPISYRVEADGMAHEIYLW